MPVLPLVGSTITVSGLIEPAFFGGINHGNADRSFNAVRRVEVLQFSDQLGTGTRRQTVKANQRCIADKGSNIV